MNSFLFKLINNLSENYTSMCDRRKNNIQKKCIFNIGFVSRSKALQLINLSKAAVASPENFL